MHPVNQRQYSSVSELTSTLYSNTIMWNQIDGIIFPVQLAEIVDKKIEDEARNRDSFSGRAEKRTRRRTEFIEAKKRYSKEQQQKLKEWKVRAGDAA